jgi:2',3'-cyclic-nucleotide 2'-phosphodiesterase/3'-nucleotidase
MVMNLLKINERMSVRVVIIMLLLVTAVSCDKTGTKNVVILETTDIHGVILPYDYIEMEELNYSMAHTASYIKAIEQDADAIFLLDNGDNLQGQPSVYYYNFIDTTSAHFLAEVMNYMKYDAATVGNHDIEAGHPVYDRLKQEYDFPLLAANAVSKSTNEPYFKPYSVIRKDGISIAVMGLITPAIPTWLPEELYRGIEFRDMVETAEKWMPEILEKKPDLVIGLFHSGWDNRSSQYLDAAKKSEDGASAVAYHVPGFDIIFTGHDHRVANEWFVNRLGDSVLILNGGSRSQNIAKAEVVFSHNMTGKKNIIRISGDIVKTADYKPDSEFIERFKPNADIIKDYVSKVIAVSDQTISSRDAFFGSSAFVDLVHNIQLEITGADLSFAAPLSFDVSIAEGPITIGDMFKLYRFENMLYTMSLTGTEIDKYLEYSYSGWTNTMRSPEDNLLKFRTGNDGKPVMTDGRAWLQNQSYNFDSAAGIDYLVDVTRPDGDKVFIKSFSNGKPFLESSYYTVAVNSYRGNGGGGLLTRGAGIPPGNLMERVLRSTDRDLRYYLMLELEEKKTINAEPLNNWRFIPENFTYGAVKRDYNLLFGSTN